MTRIGIFYLKGRVAIRYSIDDCTKTGVALSSIYPHRNRSIVQLSPFKNFVHIVLGSAHTDSDEWHLVC